MTIQQIEPSLHRPSSTFAKTDVYTDLNSLQSINNEASEDASLKKVAQQFESMFINMMLKSMRDANAVFEKDNFMNSNEGSHYRDMHDQQLALTMSHGRGLGIGDALYRQMSRNYGTANESDSSLKNVDGLVRVGSETPTNNVKVTSDIDDGLARAIEKGLSAYQSFLGPSEQFAPTSTQEFIEHLMPYAEQAAKKLGIDAGVLVAQSALETGWGKHIIKDDQGNTSFNLFNIKADQRWTGDKVSVDTKEHVNGNVVSVTADFRKYRSIEHSVDDYVKFIESNPRYGDALNNNDGAASYIEKLHQAGYATDTHYTDKVMSVYQRVADYTNQKVMAGSTRVEDSTRKSTINSVDI